MNVKLGRLPVKLSPKTYKLDKVLSTDLIEVPSQHNWANNFTWPMWCNDTVGCCTQVSVASAIRIWTVNTKKSVILTDEDVIKNYSFESGYDPKDPSTDRGGVELDVLTKWVKEGYTWAAGTNKLYAFGSINFSNLDMVKRSIYALGGCYIGLNIPDYAMQDDGWNTWRLEYENNDIVGGHAVFLHGFDSEYLYFNTWGQSWKMTYSFFNQYVEEAYGLVSENWLDGHSKLSPLLEDINKLILEMKGK